MRHRWRASQTWTAQVSDTSFNSALSTLTQQFGRTTTTKHCDDSQHFDQRPGSPHATQIIPASHFVPKFANEYSGLSWPAAGACSFSWDACESPAVLWRASITGAPFTAPHRHDDGIRSGAGTGGPWPLAASRRRLTVSPALARASRTIIARASMACRTETLRSCSP